MRILFLSQVLPYPLDAGPKIRSYYLLRYLSQRHEVTLACFTRPADPPAAIEHIRNLCPNLHLVTLKRSNLRDGWALIRSALKSRSWIITRDENKEMSALLRRLVNGQAYDAIHADQLWMAQYALSARDSAAAERPPKLVLDQHNAVFMIPKRMAELNRNPFLRYFLNLESKRLARYEVEVCSKFDHVVWVSKEDHRAVAGQAKEMVLPSKQCLEALPSVIPICVDPSQVRVSKPKPGSPNLLFVGGFHWPPNLQGVRWFFEEVFPKVRESIPNLTFSAVGKNPPRNLKGVDGMITPGYVPDLEPYWSGASIFIVPLLAGGGMRVKILDAWTHGLPIVSTSIGAEGVNYIDGENILIADNPVSFADHLVRLLKDSMERKRLGEAGRRTVETVYDWQKAYGTWDEVYSHQ